MNADTAGVLIAAIAATASAISAYTSRQSVDRANRPFVWPAISQAKDHDGANLVRVRLHNDGSGTAFDVRWSIGTVAVGPKDEIKVDDKFSEQYKSHVIRALRPGESLPPEDGDWLERAASLPLDDVWWVVVRWTDAARVRWELLEQGPALLRSEPRRLRTWPWQLWRSRREW
jgi:hypothetical protein